MTLLSTLCLALALAADIEPTAYEPLDAAAVVRGRSGAVSFTLPIQGEQVDARLLADLNLSGRISPSRSTVSVEVGGVPRWSTSLEQLATIGTQRRLDVPLGQLDAGFHAISLRFTLWVDDDPCLMEEDDTAWITLEPTTVVQLSGEAPSAVPLADLPGLWQSGEAEVALEIRSTPTPDVVLAGVEAQHVLRDWGLRPRLPTDGAGATLTLQLASELSLEDPAERARAVPLLAGDAPRATIDFADEHLIVTARDGAGLVDAVRQLRHPRLLSRCADAPLPCTVGAGPTSAVAGLEDAEDPPSTWALGRAGFPEGFVAKGAGTHRLRTSWSRPVGWDITGTPTFFLDLSLPAELDLDPHRSHVSLAINGRPVSTWHLDRRTGGRHQLEAKVPEALASAPGWDIELTVRLDAGAERCAAMDHDRLWAVLEPTSHLDVPREVRLFEGISGFGRAAAESRPRLAWTPGLTHSDWFAVATILHPLVTQTPDARWDWTDAAEADPAVPTVRVTRSGSVAATDLEWLDAGAWHDTSGRHGLPIDAHLSHPALHAEACDGQVCSGLWIELPEGVDDDVEPPSYPGSVGRHGLWWKDTWIPIDVPVQPAEVRSVAAARPAGADLLASDKARSLARFDTTLLGLGGFAAVGLGLWLWWWSRRERRHPLLGGNVAHDIER